MQGGACAGSEDRSGAAPAGPVHVVASIFPIGDIVAAVGGPAVEVEVLLPPGVGPHTFEPTPQAVRRLAGAGLFVTVGGGLDRWTAGLAQAAGSDARTLALTGGLELLHEGAGPGTGNPHVWLDPVLLRDRLLPRIIESLVRAAPAAEREVRTRAAAYADSLTALDAEIRTLLEPFHGRAFLASHSAWAYFAEQYGLRQLGAIRPAPGQEPSPRRLAALVDSARALGIRVVFTEPQTSSADAHVLAREIGARLRVLDPLGGPGVSGRDSYLALMRYNARKLAAGLGGGP